MTPVSVGIGGTAPAAGADGLVAWAEESGRRRARGPAQGGLRFAFYGRVSTEDWQDPVTSLARQREQAEALVRGRGVIVTEFFDAGQSRTVAWGRRPEAAAQQLASRARRHVRGSPEPDPDLARQREVVHAFSPLRAMATSTRSSPC